jgi:hypothetical protein
MDRDTMSSPRHGWRILTRLAALCAVAFALVALSVAAAAGSIGTSAASASATPTASAAADTCVAQIKKGTKLVPLYETYYKYAYKKKKGSKSYKKVVVKAKRKLRTTCSRQCARTVTKKQKRYRYKTVTKVVRGKKKKVRVRVGKPRTVTVTVPVYRTVKKTVSVKKGNRIVKVKKKVKVYTFQKCATTSNSASGTPVKIQLLSGSVATLDFGAFVRNAPLTGDLSGFIPGGYQLSQDNQISLSRGSIGIGATDVFIDDDCGGQVSSSIKTNPTSNVFLDPARSSTSILTAVGGITATVYTDIRLSLDLRNDDSGCNSPYISTGYQDIPQTFFFKGKIEKGLGLGKLHLTSAPDPLDVQACLSAGSPTSPCNGFAIPLPIIVSTSLYVKISIG